MATAGATRTYPTQVIPTDPTDANFEADFRSFTETLMTAIKDVDDEVSLARIGTSVFATLDARMTSIESTSGVAASFWTVDSTASATAGDTFFSVTGDQTLKYTVNRPIRVIGSNGTVYGFVGSTAYTGGGTNLTQVNLITNTGSALTLTGTFSSFAHATQEINQVFLIPTSQLAPATISDLRGTSIAMAIALGG